MQQLVTEIKDAPGLISNDRPIAVNIFSMNSISIQTKILDPKIGNTIPLPTYATSGSAGMDLRACIDHPIIIKPGETKLIGTGLAMFIDNPNYFGAIVPRSGLAIKYSIGLRNFVGIVDSDYQNEIKIALHNDSDMDGFMDIECARYMPVYPSDIIICLEPSGLLREAPAYILQSILDSKDFTDKATKFKFKNKDSLECNTPAPFTVNPGDRIAQYIIMPVVQSKLNIVDEFHTETERGLGGFGHTGVK